MIVKRVMALCKQAIRIIMIITKALRLLCNTEKEANETVVLKA